MSMSSEADAVTVTPDLLREWGLPAGGDSKYERGQVLVVGGAARSPGAALLAGSAALRVGAGRLTLAVAGSVSAQLAVALPECGVVALDETDDGHIDGSAAAAAASDDLAKADTVLIGPGLDDVEGAVALVEAMASGLRTDAVMVIDAFALGALSPGRELRNALPEALVLTPNKDEAARLLDRDLGDLASDVRELAQRCRAVVACYGVIADPAGGVWRVGTGASGLGTSGSGDVLSGAVAGFCARGVEPARAAVWASYAHAVAGDRLAVQVGPMGYLAGELLVELPRVLVEIGVGS
jgi:ADP-dependent NAD(P)H-hydrate dehydratase